MFDDSNVKLYDASSTQDGPMVEKEKNASTVWNTIKDLHMELYYMYHRVSLKLLTIPTGEYHAVNFMLCT